VLVENLIRRAPVVVGPEASLAEAARRMAETDVGSVLVTERRDVLGILTDRDLALAIGNGGTPATSVRVVMTAAPLTVQSGTDVEACLERMAEHAVRRVPVTARDGRLLGVISLDDVLLHLAHVVGRAASVVRSEIVGEVRGATS
jgi:CBS domain-containing protein